ncbi:hypothetical protein CPB85DRAFT_1218288 [Mucidula mucida]|nr:hypothetical protein CPB85DRAFT_1218288 [Mucidula mucida]
MSFAQPSSSPSRGFMPNGATSPNAFGTFYQSPRDAHAMYASLSNKTSKKQAGGASSAQSQGSQSSLKKLMCIK